jgi:hypothetical protein
MQRKARYLLTLAFLLLFGRTPVARAEPTPVRLPIQTRDIEKILGTDFYGVYLLGKKVGFARITHERVPDAKNPGIRVAQEFQLKLTAMGQRMEMRQSELQEFDARPPYALRRVEFSESNGKSTKAITLDRAAQGFDALIHAGGEKSRKHLADLNYTFADVLTPTLWLRQGPRVGDTLVTRDFDAEELKVERETRKLVSTKTSTVNGVKVIYQEVEATNPKEGFTSLERFDQQAERLLSMKVLGVFEIRFEPEKEAKNTEYSADLFVLGTAKVNKPLGEGTNLAGLILEIPVTQGEVLKSGPRQAVTRNPSGTFTCKLGKAYGVNVPATSKEFEENLADTIEYPTGHAKVQALAKDAVGDAKTPAEKVARMVHFVHGYITPSYTAEPLTLLDILKGRKGDCKAYAKLLTTLARAAGIPSREVGGLLYLGDDEKAFGGHAWNEVVLDGHWVPVDAAFDEVDINPTHITFGSNQSEGFAGLLSTLGKLSFKVVEVQRRK